MARSIATSVSVRHGEKMVELRVRFWTDGIADGKNRIIPKHAWASGVVMMSRNDAHGIDPLSPVPFNSLMELPNVIEKVLVAHKIQLVVTGRSAKLLTGEGDV